MSGWLDAAAEWALVLEVLVDCPVVVAHGGGVWRLRGAAARTQTSHFVRGFTEIVLLLVLVMLVLWILWLQLLELGPTPARRLSDRLRAERRVSVRNRAVKGE